MSSRVARTTPTRPSLRKTLALALGFFLVIGLPGVASASWITASLGSSASVASATLDVNQSGFSAVTFGYSTTALVDTALVTISNPGTVAAPYTHTIIASTATTLSNNTTLVVWTVASSANCTPQTGTPGGPTPPTMTTGSVRSGTLAVGEQLLLCVRTSVTAAGLAASSGSSTSAESRIATSIGNWTDRSTDFATQSVATQTDLVAPSTPGRPTASNITASTVTLTWVGSTDNVAVTAYDIYRGAVLVATSATNTVTLAGLASGSTATYTIRARDAAGNTSTASPGRSVTTLSLGPTYQIVDTTSGLCFDAGPSPVPSGTGLKLADCGATTVQGFVITTDANGVATISILGSPSSVFDVPGSSTANNAPITIWSATGNSNQRFSLQDDFGLVRIVVQHSGKCLEALNGGRTAGTPIVQDICSGGSNQRMFLL